ncbi:MAG: hypothetical protein FWG21_05725 [Oscillospiraceae bacterium]|nr:hypothetical protein [Oscillospiraceae bacterium]
MNAKTTVRDITIPAIAAALLVGVQVGLSMLPNIELVSLLVILYTLHLRKKTLYIIYIFAVVEGIIFGFHIWWFVYLYIWTLLFIIAYIFRTSRSPFFWAIIGGIFGLLFGALSSIPYFFISGIGGGITYIIAGIKFDLLHCAGNFALILTLFKSLDKALTRILPRRETSD